MSSGAVPSDPGPGPVRDPFRSGRGFKIWMAFNAVLLLAVSAWVVRSTVEGPPPVVPPSPVPVDTAAAGLTGGADPVPVRTKKELLAVEGFRFGLSAPQVPWSRSEVENVSSRAGARPTLLQFFVKWTEEFRPAAVDAAYRNGGLPILSWEPWAGLKAGQSQPAYSLDRIASGSYDEYLTRFATAVRDHRRVIGMRFAHEMNGSWYPWSEKQSGNQPGDYVKAWRHVHDLFERVGATNVIWIWSPNIIRPAPKVRLKPLYPGDAYVDWVGLVGYAGGEPTARGVFEPSIRQLRGFTQRPILITETGVEAGPGKAPWIADLFRWLSGRKDVVGVVWFEFSREQGGTGDWRFTADPAATAAFRAGLNRLDLAPPP